MICDRDPVNWTKAVLPTELSVPFNEPTNVAGPPTSGADWKISSLKFPLTPVRLAAVVPVVSNWPKLAWDGASTVSESTPRKAILTPGAV